MGNFEVSVSMIRCLYFTVTVRGMHTQAVVSTATKGAICFRPEAILPDINNKPRFEIRCDYQEINRMELRVIIIVPSQSLETDLIWQLLCTCK